MMRLCSRTESSLRWLLPLVVTPMPSGGKYPQVVGRCDEHDCVAVLYEDGSVQCVYELVVETRSGECRWTPLPPEWTEPFVSSPGGDRDAD